MDEIGFRPRPPETRTLPYDIEDPVSGVVSQRTIKLNYPKNESFLGELADEDPALAFGTLLDVLRQADNPEDLFTALSQIRFLRNRLGPQTGGSGRQAGKSVGKEGAFGYSSPARESLISPEADLIIDTEVWRAAERAGVPERFLSGGMRGVPALAPKGSSTEYLKVYQSIGKIGRRSSKDLDKVKADYDELMRLLDPDSPIISGQFTPREMENLFSQVNYWLSATARRLGVTPDTMGIRGLVKVIDSDLPEDKLHLAFKGAISTATDVNEINAIRALAGTKFRSVTFLDDIEADAAETAGRMIAARRSASQSDFVNPWQSRIDELSRTDAERFARDFQLRPPPGPRPVNPYGEGMGRALPYAGSNLGNMKTQWRNFGKEGQDVWMRNGVLYRSYETTDPKTKQLVHKLFRFNNGSGNWDEITLPPLRPSVAQPALSVDPKTGKFVAGEGDYVEFQGFYQRARTRPPLEPENIPPIRRLKESMQAQAYNQNMPQAEAKQVIDSVVSLVEDMVSSGQIIPGTSEYNWVHSVFGRIALNVSGPGAVVRKSGLVSRDWNGQRRAAALVALRNADEAGMVPQQASNYLKEIIPPDDIYETLMRQRRSGR
jgi:hypothetical protein